jgi:hypothetical protein
MGESIHPLKKRVVRARFDTIPTIDSPSGGWQRKALAILYRYLYIWTYSSTTTGNGVAGRSGTAPTGIVASKVTNLLPGSRTWRSASGAFSLNAQLASISNDGQTVVLKKADGSQVHVEVNKLSDSDKKLVAGLVAAPANVVIEPGAYENKLRRELDLPQARMPR